ncbi:unnamed protein product [Calicophoron daubneyi]|uniref:Uncharacterized protein n=1 Tax=Calicophoron daubneyi TaxID=300641 RepID=A0AAV2TQY0_CALDB
MSVMISAVQFPHEKQLVIQRAFPSHSDYLLATTTICLQPHLPHPLSICVYVHVSHSHSIDLSSSLSHIHLLIYNAGSVKGTLIQFDVDPCDTQPCTLYKGENVIMKIVFSTSEYSLIV